MRHYFVYYEKVTLLGCCQVFTRDDSLVLKMPWICSRYHCPSLHPWGVAIGLRSWQSKCLVLDISLYKQAFPCMYIETEDAALVQFPPPREGNCLALKTISPSVLSIHFPSSIL